MTSFMQLWISKKGSLYSCDCAKCGMTAYSHEWISDTVLNEQSMWKQQSPLSGPRCPDCGGAFDLSTFRYEGKQYAGRYTAPGYMDCTDWSYSPNHKTLAKVLREMYGEAQ